MFYNGIHLGPRKRQNTQQCFSGFAFVMITIDNYTGIIKVIVNTVL
jgi:hypothetical protein